MAELLMPAVALALMAVYLTNVGQLVHRVPDPNWLERLGRKMDRKAGPRGVA